MRPANGAIAIARSGQAAAAYSRGDCEPRPNNYKW